MKRGELQLKDNLLRGKRSRIQPLRWWVNRKVHCRIAPSALFLPDGGRIGNQKKTRLKRIGAPGGGHRGYQ